MKGLIMRLVNFVFEIAQCFIGAMAISFRAVFAFLFDKDIFEEKDVEDDFYEIAIFICPRCKKTSELIGKTKNGERVFECLHCTETLNRDFVFLESGEKISRREIQHVH